MKKVFLMIACLFTVLIVSTGCSSDSGDSGYQPIFLPNNTVQKVYYKLTLDANGGKGSTSFDRIEANHQFVLEKAQLLGVTRSNFTFLDWARNSDAETATYNGNGSAYINVDDSFLNEIQVYPSPLYKDYRECESIFERLCGTKRYPVTFYNNNYKGLYNANKS